MKSDTLAMPTIDQIKPGEEARSLSCEHCGRADAVEFGDRLLCIDCIQISGSCCAESEDDCGC